MSIATLTPFTILLLVLGATTFATLPMLFVLWWGNHISH